METAATRNREATITPVRQRQSVFRLAEEMTEMDRRASPHLYPVSNTPFLFSKDIAHLLGVSVAEVAKIPKSKLKRYSRADGVEVFVTRDVVEFIRSGNTATSPSSSLHKSHESQLFTTEEVANLLRTSVQQVRALAKAGAISFINVSAGAARPQMRFTLENINDFKSQRKTSQCQSISVPAGKRTLTTSYAQELDIQATREALQSAKRKS